MIYRIAARYPIQVIAIVCILVSMAYYSFLETLTQEDFPVLLRALKRSGILDGGLVSDPSGLVLKLSKVESPDGVASVWEPIPPSDQPQGIQNVDFDITQWYHPTSVNVNVAQLAEPYLHDCLLIDSPSGTCKTFSKEVGNWTVSSIAIPANMANPPIDYFLDSSSTVVQRVLPTIREHGISWSWLLQLIARTWMNTLKITSQASKMELLIVGTAYACMFISVISVYLKMRRLGSRFWLFSSVCMSTLFSVQFAMSLIRFSGVRISLVSLIESMPFLINVVALDKSVNLTRAVMSRCASSDSRSATHEDVAEACRDAAPPILRHFSFGIVVLAIFSYCNFGLKQFFLFSAVMVYDLLLLFTFFVSILTLNLEMCRYNANENVRRVLMEEGLSESVARRVAENNQFAKTNKKDTFQPLRWIYEPRFLFVIAFVVFNLFELCSIPFKHYAVTSAAAARLIPLVRSEYPETNTQSLLDDHVFDEILSYLFSSTHNKDVISVRILPSVFYGTDLAQSSALTTIHSFIHNWTKSIGGSFLSKWVIFGLSLSIGANIFLLNAARLNSMKNDDDKKVVEKVVEVVKYLPDSENPSFETAVEKNISTLSRPLEECISLYGNGQVSSLNDEEVIQLVVARKIPLYALERILKDIVRAVVIRRAAVSRSSRTKTLEASNCPVYHYDYSRVLNACCENVIGYIPLPLGVAGPIIIDGKPYYVPMATTEGALVASTMRGCKAINAGGGAVTVLTRDEMSRGPCIAFPNLTRAGRAKLWLDSPEGTEVITKAFNSTSRFARLQRIKTALAGTRLFIRFCTSTGDAMGMNMISKGVEHALTVMSSEAGFEDMNVISVSGNYCTDKKPAAINWIDGRGKSVIAEAIIPGEAVKSILKTTVEDLVKLNVDKNLIGSAMAGSVGGFNAHAGNVVTAIFLATGQDPAQNIESSNCITLMDNVDGNLQLSVSMPSIEVGTIGGGTVLEPQQAMLDLLGVKGAHLTSPGDNARQLAKIIAAGVMAGELSLCSALATGHLVKSHIGLNRSAINTPADSKASQSSNASNQNVPHLSVR
ncbi:3-hydroxy-3-methylglutaryl-CoA reductase Hmg1 [Schizosaccharomyces osmophilus]|uniref:3-hydroxy-3-methylglutaryl coenzyme A reductase n=1 Tax=Schizosaccharomyces osmophilus TaxID=2545709 RepID=A0AAF0AZF4_9SCHI|nr:3-hydroxy-3-methylglutaryl-CoA reductase Hmg1 [Schizosaccharomyces osmophilus]WBW75214.1 3-hydroxy-3-methylglutaryl-CoA reductase Hmg1 [Schizosaccharomyces osmophilus]